MVCLVLANEGLQPGKKNKNFHEVGAIFKQHLNAFCFHSIEKNISERDWHECSKIPTFSLYYALSGNNINILFSKILELEERIICVTKE